MNRGGQGFTAGELAMGDGGIVCDRSGNCLRVGCAIAGGFCSDSGESQVTAAKGYSHRRRGAPRRGAPTGGGFAPNLLPSLFLLMREPKPGGEGAKQERRHDHPRRTERHVPALHRPADENAFSGYRDPGEEHEEPNAQGGETHAETGGGVHDSQRTPLRCTGLRTRWPPLIDSCGRKRRRDSPWKGNGASRARSVTATKGIP